MYETYFNLSDRPFAAVPRTDHYYPAGPIDAARNTLTRCIDRGEGVALLVGPSGTGKSLLCRVLAKQFQNKLQVALLASTHLDTRRSLLQAILYELNRPWRGMDESELRLSLVDYFALNDDCADGALLLVDDAHHLPLRVMDELRGLTNLARAAQPAVRLVLAGNHLLEERFAAPKLESFSQRIAARCYLEAFTREETQAYIWARIMVSGGRGDEIFPVETCRTVHKATGGVPRLTNQVCDHVLLLACAAGVERIEPAHVEAAWADLQQLPTPWNAPASMPDGDGVIEFGGLDDDPTEMPPIAGKIPVVEEDRGLEADEVKILQAVAVEEAPLDAEGMRQRAQIRRLLDDVRHELKLAPTTRREAESAADALHPFAEPFEEEEVIAERYLIAAPPAMLLTPLASLPSVAATSKSFNPEPTTRARKAAPHIESPHHAMRLRLDAAAGQPAESDSGEPKRCVVPPPHMALGHLFAKLRKGL